MDFYKIAPIVFSAITAIVMVTGLIVLVRFKTEQNAKDVAELKKTDLNMTEELKSIVTNLNGVVVQLAGMGKEQAVINIQVAKTLGAVVDKLDALTEKVNKNELELAVIKAKLQVGHETN